MSTALAQPNSFRNRVVIVTGAAGSIGRPLSIALAKAGAKLVLNDFGGSVTGEGSSPAPATSLVEEIKSQGGSAIASTHNVATQGAEIVSTAISAYGRVDVIINNAGIIRYKSVSEHTIADFKETMDVNTFGPISLILAAWPYFKSQKFGRVVNFTSDSIFGLENTAAYVTSKAALIGVTKSFAVEGEEFGIKVNCVAPTAFSRMGGDDIPFEAQREDFKNKFHGEGNVPMILALAHEKASVNGQVFSTGAFAVNHVVQGFKNGVKELKTMEECLERTKEILNGGGDGRIESADHVFDYMAKSGSAK